MPEIILYIVLGVLFLGVFPLGFIQLFVARHLYFLYFVRSDSENWTRDLIPTDDEEDKMYKSCEVFEKENQSYKTDVEIESDGFKLKGEYYDYGYDRAVIIVAGRSEALRYSYYFAYPYKKSNFNILVIDNRSHGLSEGKYNSLGFKEYRDVIKWAELLHDKFNNKLVIGHGICIGSATLLYAQTSPDCPDYFRGIVADGMYVNFPESFNNHALEAGHSPHFVSEILFAYFKHYTHEDPYKGPIDVIDKMDKPILFIYGLQDNYSKPDKGKDLFNKCISKEKELEWFKVGTHSHLRVNDEAHYDEVIINYLKIHF